MNANNTNTKKNQSFVLKAMKSLRCDSSCFEFCDDEAAIRAARQRLKKESTTEQIIESLLLTIKAKDEYTLKHSVRVARYSAVIACRMNLHADDIYKAYLSGLLHDIGKIYVPDSILFKNGRLSEDEFNIIKCHPIQSEIICRPIKALHDILPIIRAHHERYDGCGYPDGLAWNNIPLIARIIAVSDTLDATTSNRPYQKNMPIEKVCHILEEGAGKQWDADVVRTALNCFSKNNFVEALIPRKWAFNYSTAAFQYGLNKGTSFTC